jgi:hypothetical protein
MTEISGPYDPNGSDEQGRLSLDGKRYSHLLQVGFKGFILLIYVYSQTCIKRSPLGEKKVSF